MSDTTRMFEERGRDNFDKMLLAGAFFVGIFGSMVLKFLSFGMWIPAFFAASVILIYAVLTYQTQSARLEPDQIGDNAYYLGFVLTLCSLAYTLYELGGQETESDFIKDVIAGFGVALSSTIIGVAVRVFMQQFRLDLTARDQEARLAINEAMRAFRNEIVDSIRGLKLFGAEIRQSLDEHHKSANKADQERLEAAMSTMLAGFETSLGKMVDDTHTANREIAERAGENIEALQSVMTGALQQIDISFVETGKSLSATTQVTGETTMRNLAEYRRALEENAALTARASEQIARSISTLDEGLKVVMGRIEKEISSTTTSTEQASTALAETAIRLKTTVALLDADIGALAQQVRQLTGAIAPRGALAGAQDPLVASQSETAVVTGPTATPTSSTNSVPEQPRAIRRLFSRRSASAEPDYGTLTAKPSK